MILWRGLEAAVPQSARVFLLAVCAACPLVILMRSLGLGDVLIQLLLNLVVTGFAISLLFLLKLWNNTSK